MTIKTDFVCHKLNEKSELRVAIRPASQKLTFFISTQIPLMFMITFIQENFHIFIFFFYVWCALGSDKKRLPLCNNIHFKLLLEFSINKNQSPDQYCCCSIWSSIGILLQRTSSSGLKYEEASHFLLISCNFSFGVKKSFIVFIRPRCWNIRSLLWQTDVSYHIMKFDLWKYSSGVEKYSFTFSFLLILLPPVLNDTSCIFSISDNGRSGTMGKTGMETSLLCGRGLIADCKSG